MIAPENKSSAPSHHSAAARLASGRLFPATQWSAISQARGENESKNECADVADDEVTPEVAFDRQWAAEMTGRAVNRVSADYEKRGRSEWFAALAAALPGGGVLKPYADLPRSFPPAKVP